MNEESRTQPGLKAGSQGYAESALKLAAVVGAASLLIGVTYNIVFFFGEKHPWLFYLAVADNVTATMYALQGNRVNALSGDDACEEVVIPCSDLAA